MATPPDSPGPEEAFFEFESTRVRQQTTRPVPIEELLRQTKFSRQEIRVMYRGFKQVRTLLTYRPGVIDFSRDFHLNRKKLRVRNYAKAKNAHSASMRRHILHIACGFSQFFIAALRDQ
jgi:hypothetical protein